MRANKALCGKHFSLERFAPENICGPGHCAPQVPRLHRSYTPPMNCGCSDVAAPSAVNAKRVTDKESRAEARFVRLREHFSSRKCSISIRQAVCSLFPLPRSDRDGRSLPPHASEKNPPCRSAPLFPPFRSVVPPSP